MIRKLSCTAWLLLGASAPTMAMECPIPFCPSETCYKAWFLNDDPCGKALQYYEAPAPADVFCTRVSYEYQCEAWPQSDEETNGITYTWTSGGAVTLLVNGPTSDPLQAITCTGAGSSGWVNLNVSSPFGVNANKFIGINCGPPTQEY